MIQNAEIAMKLIEVGLNLSYTTAWVRLITMLPILWQIKSKFVQLKIVKRTKSMVVLRAQRMAKVLDFYAKVSVSKKIATDLSIGHR